MRLAVYSTVVFFSALLLAVPASAMDDILMKDGRVRRGKIVSVEENGLVVKFRPAGGGSAQMLVKAEQLDPHFFYEKRSAAAGDDAKAHLKLGLWAFENGLWSRAKIAVRKATELDPKLIADIQSGKLHEIRDKIAQRILESAKKDMKDGNAARAEKKLEALLARMADTEAGAGAAELIRECQRLSEEAAAQAEKERKAKMDADALAEEEAREKLLEPVRKDLLKGKELMTDGLTEDSESQALKLLRQAISKGESALKKIEKLEEKQADDAKLIETITEWKKKAIAAMVKMHIHRADIYAGRPSIPNAKKELEAARKLDPDNPNIDMAAQRIEDREEEDRWEIRWRRQRAAGEGRFGRRGRVGVGRGR
ncbi:MAG: hypothetical protein QNJ98_15915 [Planctomycetota bacterium]|nr:hypothetical protein [Planctomycetota bacterium]